MVDLAGPPRKRSLFELYNSDLHFLTFGINTAIDDFIANSKDDKKFIESSLISIFWREKEARDLLLFMISTGRFSNLASDHGIAMNGRCRGITTRVMINKLLWKRFTLATITPAYALMRDKVSKKIEKRIETSSHSMCETTLNFQQLKRDIGSSRKHSVILHHIQQLYNEILSPRSEITVHNSDSLEFKDSISVFEETLLKSKEKFQPGNVC